MKLLPFFLPFFPFSLSKVGVIDFSMYLKNDIDDYRSEERCVLRRSGTLDSSDGHQILSRVSFSFCFRGNRNSQIASILDQKNYVEELNRQLK